MALAPPIVNAIVQGAKARGLDPNAVLAVARQEGLSGRVGDNGTSFGPWQLHRGGALPGNIPLGQAQAWATSPAGINYALDRIASVARGLHGAQAVSAIVSRFERPANPAGEIARANASLGQSPAGGGIPSIPTPGAFGAPPTPQTGLPPALQQILALNRQAVGLPEINFGPLTAPAGPRQTPVTAPGGPPAGAVATPPKSGSTIKYLEHIASPFGLTVTATTNGQHARGSYHYRGRAVDFGGNPENMAALAKFAFQHADAFQEFIYTGPGNPGFAVLGGKVIPNEQLSPHLYQQHLNHVHLAR